MHVQEAALAPTCRAREAAAAPTLNADKLLSPQESQITPSKSRAIKDGLVALHARSARRCSWDGALCIVTGTTLHGRALKHPSG